MSDVDFFKRELARLELWLDIFDEVQVSFFRVRIIRVTRHRNVTAGRFLASAAESSLQSNNQCSSAAALLAPAACRSNWSNSGAICGQSPRSMACGTNFRGLYAGNFPNGSKFMCEGYGKLGRGECFLRLELGFDAAGSGDAPTTHGFKNSETIPPPQNQSHNE